MESHMSRITSQPDSQEILANVLSRQSTGAAMAGIDATLLCNSDLPTIRLADSVRDRQRRRMGGFLTATILLLATAVAHGQSVFARQTVNTTTTQTVSVAAQIGGTVNTVEVLTLGAGNLEFAKGTSVSLNCESQPNLVIGATCQESITFTPASPGLRLGAVVLLDSNNDVLGTTFVSGTGSGGLGAFVPGNVMTVAGIYKSYSSTQNSIPAIQANLDQPSSIAFDGNGNMYIADSGPNHNQIRMVCASSTSAMIFGTSCPGPGIIVRIAGTGDPGYSGDGGLASVSTLNSPSGVALDGAGNLFIADTGNNVIRRIDRFTGLITTVAGSLSGTGGFQGEGVLATSAELNAPEGVTVDGGGNLYIADTANHRIRKVAVPIPPAVSGIITTFAGNGLTSGIGDGKGTWSGDGHAAILAGLSLPYAVALDASGNVYIPDSGNNRIRMVDTSGNISTVVGTGVSGDSCAGPEPTSAVTLNIPSAVAVDPAGNLYIADTQDSCIWQTNLAAGTTTPIASNGRTTITSNGSTVNLQVYAPVGLYLDGYGNLYFADYYDMLVEEIDRTQAIVNDTAPAIRLGNLSQPVYLMVENDGNSALDLTTINPDQNSAVNGQGDSPFPPCTIGSPFLAVNADCVIGAVFAPSKTLVFPPSVPEEQILASINVGKPGDTANSPLAIELIGEAAAVNSTTIDIVSSSAVSSPSNYTSLYGQNVTFTATVETNTGTGNLSGTVTFFDGTTPLQPTDVSLSPPPGTTASASLTTSLLKVGPHTITATYNNDNDPNHFSSTSAALMQNVLEATTTTVTSSLAKSAVGQSVTFTATVAISGGGGVAPDGTVAFYDGATPLETAASINSGGVATYSTATLTQGTHAITAIYSGDGAKDIQASTSNVLNQDVQASTTSIISSTPNPSNFGASASFTAVITPSGSAAATGTVTFLDGGSPIKTVTLGTNNQATFSTSTLSAGTHTITATYAGDTNNASSTTAAMMQIVNKTTPNLAWSTPAAITYGTPLGATQLNASSGGVAGTWTYTPPAGSLLAAGAQTLSVSFLPSDSTDYNVTTATVPLIVNKASPTVTVSTSGSPSIYGAAITFTATFSSGPTGTVTFYDSGNPIGTGSLENTTATFSTTGKPLSVGVHAITASWAGDGNYTAVASSPITQTVNVAAPVITWPSPAPISYGTALGAIQLDASTTIAGSLIYSPGLGTVLGAGSRTLSVSFTPTDTVDYSSVTATVTLQVSQVVPTITWSAPAAITYGTPLGAAQLNASSGAIAGAFDYVPPAGTVLPAGVQTLSASFLPSDTTDFTSPTSTVPLTVNKASPTLTVGTSGTPSTYGAAVTFTATSSSGPTGAVTFYDGGNPIGTGSLENNTATFSTAAKPLSVGVHTITASWAGNSNFNQVTSSPIVQTVNLTQTSTTLSSLPNPGIAGLAVALTAMVKLTAGVATPTGTVAFADEFNGVTIPLGSSELVAEGGTAWTATVNPRLAPGVHTIIATYSGDADTSGSTSAAFPLTINLATTVTTVIGTPSAALVLAPITLAAMVSGNGGPPTGTVTFYANNSTALGTGILGSNGTTTITFAAPAVGSYQITAVYAGDTNNAGATSSVFTETVGAIPTTASLGFGSTGTASPGVILAATVVGVSGPTPTGNVEFRSGSNSLGSASLDSTGVATLNPNLALGAAYTIVAAYTGDALHSASTSAPVQLNGTATDYTISVTPPSLTLAQSKNAMLMVSLSSSSGFTDTIGLGCGSLPAGMTCHFSSPNVALAANADASAQLTIDTSNPLGGGASASAAHLGNKGTSLAGLMIPFCALFGCFFRRFRRRYASVLASMLLIVLAATLVIGCSGITQASAAPGTYTIQVFGTGANSNITHFENVIVTITQ